MKIKSIIPTVIITIMFANCSKTDQMETINNQRGSNEIHLKGTIINMDGNLLNFSDDENYRNFVNEISQLGEKEYINWATENRLCTSRLLYLQLLETLKDAKDELEFYSIIDENSDIVHITGEGNDRTLRPIIENTLFSSITDQNGMFCIDSKIFRVLGSRLVYGPKYMKDAVQSIDEDTNIEDLPQGLSSYQFETPHRMKTSCGDEINVEVIKNLPNCGNDRKVEYQMKITYSVGYYNDQETFYWTIETKSKSFYKLFCVWTGGPSTHYHKDQSGTIVSPCGSYNWSLSDKTESDVTTSSQSISGNCLATQGPLPYFSVACGKASSDGVGSTNYAVISCNCN